MATRRISFLFLTILIAPVLWAQDGLSLTPSAKNADDWIAFIRPSEDELSFERIGWRNQFWPAVAEARSLGRPILLWTMNGHPLGCT